jgi:hypothetical protein
MIGSRSPIAVKPGIIGSSMSTWGKKLEDTPRPRGAA